MLLIKLLAVYSAIVVSVVSIIVLSGSSDPRQRAIIMMGLGLLLIWVLLGGSMMLKLRDRVRKIILGVPLDWRAKFILFATGLALVEEAITVTMTNLAPVFGSKIGEAYITASDNYAIVVLFHSVIVFIPMFVAWAYLLSRYDFTHNSVFLLFGFLGTTAEASINPTSLIAGFWFFVYGLMVYLPAYSIPRDRGALRPRARHYVLAVLLPMAAAIPVAGVVTLVRRWLQIQFFPGVPS